MDKQATSQDINLFFKEAEQDFTQGKFAELKLKLIERQKIEENNKNYLIHFQLGFFLYNINDYQAAAVSYLSCIKNNPNFADVYFYSALIYFKSSNFEKAIEFFSIALRLGFKDQSIFGLLASCYQMNNKREFYTAKTFYEKQMQLFPEDAKRYKEDYTTCLRTVGMADEAVKELLELLKEKPESIKLYRETIAAMAHSWSYTDQDIKRIAQLNNQNSFYENSFKFDFTQNLRRKTPRVGFMFTFTNKSAGSWLEDLFRVRSSNFVYAAYHNSHIHDETTENIKQCVDIFRNISRRDGQEIAQEIYQDEIDILFDIRTNVPGERPDIIKLKPAPVQANWLDSFPPSGLPEMDYTFFDKYLVPEEDDINFTEKVFRLPYNYFYYKLPDYDVKVEETPCIKNGFVTFASFHRSAKLNEKLLRIWAQILKKVDNSKLLIKCPLNSDQAFRKYHMDIFKSEGISEDRIIQENQEDLKQFFHKCNEVDIVLDSFPMNGGSTLLRTLWMSKPMVTLVGKRNSCRTAYSILKTLGLDEMIVNSQEEYINKAVELANDYQRLQDYTLALRDKFVNSNICNAQIFQKGFEDSLQEIWDNYLKEHNK